MVETCSEKTNKNPVEDTSRKYSNKKVNLRVLMKIIIVNSEK
jgi:hypothetical protein